MKKRRKTMTGILILMAVLLLCYFVIVKIQENADDEEVIEETLYAVELEDVVSVKYTDGTTEMSFIKTDDVWYYEADETITLDQSLMETMVSSLSFIEATKEITEPDALSDYGLEEAAYTIELTDGSGKTIKVYVGNAVDSYSYYLAVDDKEVVYTVDSSVVSALEFDVESLEEVEETEEETTEEETTEEASEEETTDTDTESE